MLDDNVLEENSQKIPRYAGKRRDQRVVPCITDQASLQRWVEDLIAVKKESLQFEELVLNVRIYKNASEGVNPKLNGTKDVLMSVGVCQVMSSSVSSVTSSLSSPPLLLQEISANLSH